jgi:signal peptide peptidase SppA
MKTGLQLWAGTQQSYEGYLEGMLKARADAGFKADFNYDSQVLSQILSVDNGVGVINIAGSLVEGSAGFGVFFGMIGYNDIRNALAAAVTDPAVQSIMLNIGSGGGMVAGCHECSQLIARVDTIKPVVTYTGSAMASAALWLGSQGQYAVASETAIVGSIGILMVHMDRSQELAQAGIKPTIIRAGSEKALATPFEALTAEAKDALQTMANDLYDIFLPQVAAGRGVAVTTADKKFGQGREFLGKAAKTAGLVDAVGTYEDAMKKAMALMKKAKTTASASRGIGATNNSNVQAQASTGTVLLADNLTNHLGTSMKTQTLSAEQLAAMAAGVELGAEKTEEEIATESAAAAAAELARVTAREADEALAAGGGTTSVAAVAPLVNEAVALLKGMLATANQDLLTARVETATAVAALAANVQANTAAATQAAAMTDIARASVRTMGLHFGTTAEAAAAMTPAEVLAEHTRLSGLFRAKFKVGGVAATSLGKPEADAKAPTMTDRELEIAIKLPRAK